MGNDFQRFRELVSEFEVKYRGAGLDAFEVSEPYDLTPELGNSAVSCCSAWPNTWLHSGRAGVYAFFGDQLQAVYIGKVSLQNCIGSRLGYYFAYGQDRTCRFNHPWKTRPRYVVTVAVPDASRFEAPALEEFLIGKLRTTDNKAGVVIDGDLCLTAVLTPLPRPPGERRT